MDDSSSNNFENTPQQPETYSAAPAPAEKKRKSKKVLWILLVLLLAAGLAAGVYFWQQQKLNDQKSSLDSKISSLEAQLSAKNAPKSTASTTPAPTTQSSANRLVAGQIDFNTNAERGAGTAGTRYIQGLVLPEADWTAVWAEYDKGPSFKSVKQTEHVTKELGMGEAGNYGDFSFTVPKSGLEPGVNYFYRIVGTTKDGKTVYSDVAAFTNRK